MANATAMCRVSLTKTRTFGIEVCRHKISKHEIKTSNETLPVTAEPDTLYKKLRTGTKSLGSFENTTHERYESKRRPSDMVSRSGNR